MQPPSFLRQSVVSSISDVIDFGHAFPPVLDTLRERMFDTFWEGPLCIQGMAYNLYKWGILN